MTASVLKRRRMLFDFEGVRRNPKPVSPGEMLAEGFLQPLGTSSYRLAKEIGMPAQCIGEIVAGERTVTADIDLRRCRALGLSDGWWLRLQADCDTEVAKASLAMALANSSACEDQAAQGGGGAGCRCAL
jgi:addiction module HigA family antidote